jgi:acetylcholinesterase
VLTIRIILSGQAHATDLLNVWTGGDLTDFLVNFVNNLDPNGAGGHLDWPAYTKDSPNLMTFLDGLVPEIITQDTYREEQMAYLTQLSLAHPF